VRARSAGLFFLTAALLSARKAPRSSPCTVPAPVPMCRSSKDVGRPWALLSSRAA